MHELTRSTQCLMQMLRPENAGTALTARLGALVIDHQFGTTDVLIVKPVSAIKARYIEHFGVDASRHAA